MRRGSKRIRAPEAGGACCAGAGTKKNCSTAQRTTTNTLIRMKPCKGMRGIVVENRVSMKATLERGAEITRPMTFG
jgi:hypothetical protein